MFNDQQFTQDIKSKPYVIKQMTEILNNSEYKTLRDKLTKKRKTNSLIILCFGLIFTVVAFFAGWMVSEKQIFVGIIPAVIVLLMTLGGIYVVYRNAKKNYTSVIAPQIIEALYGPKANYNPNGGYARDYLVGIDCFPVNKLNQDTLIEGHYFGIPFTIANVESYHYETRGSGKDAHQEKVTDFYGSVMSFKMNKPSESIIKVVEGSNLFKGNTIDFESSAFNKKFNTYCDDREHAFYIITPQLQLAMLDIEKALPGGLKFIFRGQELVLVASSNTTSFKGVDIKKSDNHNINAILDDILGPAFIIEKMNLDHKFFLDESDLNSGSTSTKKDDDNTILSDEDVASIKKAVKDETGITKEDIDKVKETIDSESK